jgi:hypothetical protein
MQITIYIAKNNHINQHLIDLDHKSVLSIADRKNKLSIQIRLQHTVVVAPLFKNNLYQTAYHKTIMIKDNIKNKIKLMIKQISV